MRTVWDVIKSPVITEKALVAKEETQDRRQLLTFRVDRRATKPEIKNAVESIFQVKVDSVRTAQYLGKMARRGRHEGRNHDGRITVRRRGGGHKRFYRVIDFRRNKDGVPGRVTQIEYDPNRSSNIALITYLDGEKRYIIAPVGLEVGRMIASGEDADILPGNTLPIRNIPLGTQIHNIELRPGKGGQMARAAGSFAQLLAKEGDYAQLRMPSGEVRRVPVECRATVSQVGNAEHENISLGKAGRSRWRGIRPHVRGVAMNPGDHPHSGGGGQTASATFPSTLRRTWSGTNWVSFHRRQCSKAIPEPRPRKPKRRRRWLDQRRPRRRRKKSGKS